MAFPSRRPLRDIPFQSLLSLLAIQSLAIILENTESVCRQVLRELGYGENEANNWYDRFKRPVFEALMSHQNRKKTVQELYRILSSINETQALQKLYTSLCEELNYGNVPETATDENWRTLLHSTQHEYGISRPQVFMRTYIFPTCNCVKEIVYMVFPFSTVNESDMYRSISILMNNMIIAYSILTLAQNAMAIYLEGSINNVVAIIISFSLWIKLYLITEPFNQLKEILPSGNDEQKHRKADFLYKKIRTAIQFVFFFKLALAILGCVLFYAIPKFLQSKMTQVGLFLFICELAHNAFYLIVFYRNANIFSIINDFFPSMYMW